MLKTAAYTT